MAGGSSSGRSKKSSSSSTTHDPAAAASAPGDDPDGAKATGAAAHAGGDAPGAAADTVGVFLATVGMMQYASVMETHDVDETNFHHLDAAALEAFGIQSWGHRMTILKAVARRRRQVADDEDYSNGAVN
eukprot:CAMPEP_0173406616 /NCGR_PEP_ID=MMETSP1356-20130122/65047_1 /TAXON_ID=77927 ORGANISM="Hemiselmis virescens, Strain PCC157" /NCGR_SAMPLE_ID=MMETSP1356 /ASSEMBLY_ACC=CAM_ASM_000847 /LENGTH=128 /DNA_ID=CAMNT_0014367633 /DNA_START=114 /DNA_END=497 /DNA_ORIENTATION=-